MKKRTRRYFLVKGNSSFPYDMLRYDQCWPIREAEAGHLSDDKYTSSRELRTVVMGTDNPTAPTHGRWRSFGWDVEPITNSELMGY